MTLYNELFERYMHLSMWDKDVLFTRLFGRMEASDNDGFFKEVEALLKMFEEIKREEEKQDGK